MNILMVLTSHHQLGDTGKKTGFWLEEFAAPYYVFKDAGARITLASPNGGQLPLDPSSDAEGAQTDAIKRPKGEDGKPLVSGKTVTGFTNTEEEAVGLTKVVPFPVEDMLKTNGGSYQKGDDWASFVVTDGKLATGRNPASSEEAARKLLALL